MKTKHVANEVEPPVGAGWAFYLAGWGVFILSFVFALSGKTSEPHSALPFWVAFGILVAVSLAYLVGCLISASWRSKATGRYFSPYLLGACGWLFLFLLFWVLDRLAG